MHNAQYWGSECSFGVTEGASRGIPKRKGKKEIQGNTLTFSEKKKKSYLKIMGIAEECLSTEDICHFLIANLQNKNKNSDGF